MTVGSGPCEEGEPCSRQIRGVHSRLPVGGCLLVGNLNQRKVATRLRQLVQALRAALDPLVLDQSAYQLRARVLLHVATGWTRKKHARLDLDQHGRHQQILGGKLETASAHQLDVFQVLAREPDHRNVENVDVFLADEVQQQIEGPLELLEENFQCVGWNVEVPRDLE